MNSNKNKTEEEIYLEKGDALYKENLYKEAIAEYNNALKINPENLVTQLKIAKARLSDNNLKGSTAAYDLGEKHSLTQKPPEIKRAAEAPVRKRPSRTKVLVRNIIYITPVVIIILLTAWYFISAKENRIDSVPSKSTADINVKMSPEGADLIFGKTENPEPEMANEPVKSVTDKKPIKENRVDVAKKGSAKKAGSKKPFTNEKIVKKEKGPTGKRGAENGNAKKAGPKRPVTNEKIVKEDRGPTEKREAENVEEPGFWATLKKYLLSLFKDTGHQESGGKGIIRDPLGAEKK